MQTQTMAVRPIPDVRQDYLWKKKLTLKWPSRFGMTRNVRGRYIEQIKYWRLWFLWHIHACFCGCCGRRICGYIKPSVCRWTDLLLWRLCGSGSTGTAVWNIWTAICDSKRYERTFLAEPACVFRGSDCVYVLVCVPGCGDCIFAYDSCYCMDPGSFRSALYQWCSGGISFCCVFFFVFLVWFSPAMPENYWLSFRNWRGVMLYFCLNTRLK